MQDHRTSRGGLRPSFAGLLTLLVLIGLSGGAAAIAFGSDDPGQPRVTGDVSGPSWTLSVGRFPDGAHYQLTASESEQGTCLAVSSGDEADPGRICGVDVNSKTGDVNVTYVEVEGNVLIAPLLSERVSRISVAPVRQPDGGAPTVDLGEGVEQAYADAEPMPNMDARVAVIAAPLTSSSSAATDQGAPLSVAFVLTAYDDDGAVLSKVTTTAERKAGLIDETR